MNNDNYIDEYLLNLINTYTLGVILPITMIFFNYLNSQDMLHKFKKLKDEFITTKQENHKLKKDIGLCVKEIDNLIKLI